MSLRSAIHIALANFRRHKMRTVLSSLGIIIGILSVSLIITFGKGVKSFVLSQVTSFGTDIIDITTKIPSKGTFGTAASMVQGIKVTTLKTADLEAAEDFSFVTGQAGFAAGQAWATHQGEEANAFIFATGYQYINIDQQSKLKKGRFFNYSEQKGLSKILILGSEIKENLFGDQDALGKKVKVQDHTFKVIGVLASRGQVSGFNLDTMIMLPVTTGQKLLLGIDYINEGLIQVKPGTNMELAVSRLEALLRRRHKINDPTKDDFLIMSLDEALEIAQDVSTALNFLLIFLASISLLVGGIGIMNIMLVSLSERIREVGLRKAIGANDNDILKQFLIESTLLTSFGGLLGISLAFSLTLIVKVGAQAAGLEWPLSFPIGGFLIVFFVSILVGVLFGIYPARKAAQLDPIEAIRHE